MDSWPTGFWEGRVWDALNIVELNALPRTPDTLPLRLLGRRDTLIEAIRDLGDLPEAAWPKRLLVPVLVAFRADITEDPEEKEAMQTLREIDTIYEQWEKRVKDEGRKEGREEGRQAQRVVLLSLLGQRFGELPGHVRARVEQADSELLLRWTQRVIPARVLADIFE